MDTHSFRRVLYLLSLITLLLPSRIEAQREWFSPRKYLDTDESHWFHFRTRPDLQAPKFQVRIYDRDALSPGYWFIDPYEAVNQTERGSPWVGPFIYDQKGDLIWAGTPTLDHYKSFDLKVTKVNNTDMMTRIFPHDNAGLILNSHYEIERKVIYDENPDLANMHDFNLVDNGAHALVLMQDNHGKASVEMSATIGYEGNCSVHGNGLKEIDITSSPPRTIFEWNGLDHIGLDETTARGKSVDEVCSHGWDIHHFNSIDKFPDGDYLLSSRHTDTIYKISHTNGSVVWRIGGKKSDFELPDGARFSRQHHARVVGQNDTHTLISLFDNAKGTDNGNVASAARSRGLIFALQPKSKTAELMFKAGHPNNKYTNSRGSTQLLPDGNVFMCWAYHTRLSEHAPDGRLIMHANLKKNIHTYRAYKFPWVGHPKQPPNVHSAAFIAGNDTSTMTYVSWNGATEVVKWNLYEADEDGKRLGLLNSTVKHGFETVLTHDRFVKHVLVEALDHNDRTLGKSNVFTTVPPIELSGKEPPPLSNDVDETADMTMEDHATDMAESSSAWPGDLTSTLLNPISAFVSGFVACGVVVLVFWSLRGKSWASRWRQPKQSTYTPVDRKDEEIALDIPFELEDDDTEGEETEFLEKT